MSACLTHPTGWPLVRWVSDDYAAATHVFISYEGTWRPSYRDLIEARGIAPRMVIDLRVRARSDG